MRRQNGSLRKRKAGGSWTWLGTWWADGHRRAKTLGKCASMSKTDAQAELRKLLQPLNEAKGATEYTLQGYARTVVFPWYRRSWKPSTAKTTEDRIDHHILKELGNQPLSFFTRETLQNFLDKKAASKRKPRRKKGKENVEGKELLSHSTIAHLRWDLRQLFRMAVNDGLLPRNPAELLHTPKPARRDKRVLSLDELCTILSALPLRERLIISLAAISGLRPGEILALQWGEIAADGLRITRAIYRGIIQTPKTHHSVRTAAISTSIRDDLDQWRAIAPNTNPDDWVFANERGNKPLAHGNYWRRNIKPTLNVLRISGVTFQALRRTAVTLLNDHGADATIVAAQCGHTVDVSTNIYNKIGIQRQQEAINALEQAITTAVHTRQSKGKRHA
jgi:integrase